MKNIFKTLTYLILLGAFLFGSIDVSVSTIDNIYDNTSVLGYWEIHHKYKVQVKLYNNSSSAQSFNRVEANLDFDSTKFDLLSKTDNISGWTATNFFLVQNGHVQYQRGSNTGETAISIPGYGSYILYELNLQVKETTLGNSSFNLDTNFTHALYNITDLTNNKTNLTVYVVDDKTPPVTRIVPAGDLHLNQSISVILQVDPNTNTNCGDLKEIRYTVDGTLPSLSSPIYSSAITLAENRSTTIRWLGVDTVGNMENYKTAIYRVDTIKPVITSIYTQPPEPVRIKNNAILHIYFTATDEIELSQTNVTVGNNTATFVEKNGNNYHYTFNVQGLTDGEKTIAITARDHAGNTRTDSSKQIYVDNTVPTFNLDYITPASAGIGTTVVFQFEASEELDLARSTINIGSNSPVTFMAREGLHYRFSRQINGTETSGWIKVTASDLAGNVGYNLDNNNTIYISGYDLMNNFGEANATFNIKY